MGARPLACVSRMVLLGAVAVCASCSFFSRQPPLPKHAAIESSVTPETDEQFAAFVQSADIIYFPTELVALAPRSEAAEKLVEALHRNGGSFALGFDLFAGEEQTALDRWAKEKIPVDDLLQRIRFMGDARERESCRALLGVTKQWSARLLGLGHDIAAGADMEEFAADRIAKHFREHGFEKLLVFMHRRHLRNGRGVPLAVAGKIQVRQLVLDSRDHPRSQLWALVGTRRRGFLAGRLKIVDSAPTAGRDQF